MRTNLHNNKNAFVLPAGGFIAPRTATAEYLLHSRGQLDVRNLSEENRITVCSEPGRFPLVRDCAQSFHQRLALLAIVDHECVVFAMR